MHVGASRIINTLADIGSKVDDKSKGFHIAAGIFRRVMKPDAIKKFYQYCPSTEGTLPAWREMEDHLTRWLKVCFDIYEHPDGKSYSRFPGNLILEAFPEIVDIDMDQYFHAFHATKESMLAYGFNIKQSWDRNVPTLLHQGGAMQQFMPYHDAVYTPKYQSGDRFEWETGVQNHTYAKDIFELDSNEDIPICPALRLKATVDGTCSPSYDGIARQIPKVMFITKDKNLLKDFIVEKLKF